MVCVAPASLSGVQIPLLALFTLASLPTVAESAVSWRGTKAAKTCKVCEFLVGHMAKKGALEGIVKRKQAARILDDACENYKVLSHHSKTPLRNLSETNICTNCRIHLRLSARVRIPGLTTDGCFPNDLLGNAD
eukprot:SAG11_NODE_9877_length_873_cov_1.145995_1_plen_134_part_00